MKTLIKNGRIYDGTGNAPFVGDILINGDRIEAVAPDIDCGEATVIDASGKSVSSGFFDAHSHNDWFAIRKEPLKFFEPFIRQGFTSFVTGNCGLSATGFDANSELMGGGLFGFKDTTGIYGDVKTYLEAIDSNTPCNIAVLLGHCSARASVAGMDNRELTKEEQERMLGIMEQGLKDGACGLSLGLMYEPGLYAPTDELKGIAKLCEKYDRPLTVHPRAESKVSMSYPELLGRPHILRALDELVEVTRGTKTKLQYSHAIFVGRSSFGCKDEVMRIIEDMRKNGVDAMFDIYDELLGVSVITVIMPGWYQALTPKDKRKFFNKLKFAVLVRASIILLGFGWKDITIAYVGKGNEKYEGKTVYECSKLMHKSCLDAYLDLCEMSDFKGRVNMGPYSTREIIEEQSKSPLSLYMTDAWVEDYGVQNPALYDCFPKFLKDSLEGRGDDMPHTIRKMTGGVADRFSIPERGYVKPGYFADITIFDEEELKAGIPDREKAFGIDKVLINGRLVLDGDRLDTEALKNTGRAMKSK